jgi:hypothetical protein
MTSTIKHHHFDRHPVPLRALAALDHPEVRTVLEGDLDPVMLNG